MNEFFKQMLTESDNSTADVFRWLAVVSVLVGLGLSIYSVGWQNEKFDMQKFGAGVGILLAGVGVALKLKPETQCGTSTSTTYTSQTTDVKKPEE
ncbi:MAG: hypothetical protein JWR22_1348 [Herminiimonas sp.]|nr:hypothetical protein [Herminiimonas sp.]